MQSVAESGNTSFIKRCVVTSGKLPCPFLLQWGRRLPIQAANELKQWAIRQVKDMRACFVAIYSSSSSSSSSSSTSSSTGCSHACSSLSSPEADDKPREEEEEGGGGGESEGGVGDGDDEANRGVVFHNTKTNLKLREVVHDGHVHIQRLVVRFLVHPKADTRRLLRELSEFDYLRQAQK
jgi:hypothetical protein